MSNLVEELKRRSASLLEKTARHLELPIKIETKRFSYKDLKSSMTEALEKAKDTLRKRADELQVAIEAVEQEHVRLEDAITSIDDVINAIDDVPDEG